MKQRLSNSSLFQFIRIRSKIIATITLFAFMNFVISCSYYKSRSIATNPDNLSNQYKSIDKKERYTIIHSGNETWHLSNIVVNENKKEITASLSAVDTSHTLYSLKGNSKSKRYHKSKSKKTLEIHFYTNQDLNKSATSEVVIPFAEISKIEVYERDTLRTVFSVVGFTVAALAIVAIIVVATKSSCPFVYIKNVDSFAFTGELYPGAILPTLERTDYLPLQNFKAQNEEYELKITNELLEIQYTDLAQLVVLNHPKDNEVLLDQNGKPHTISKEETPKEVIINDNSSNKEPSLKRDNSSYLFNQEGNRNQWNNVILTFDNPNQSNQAKLVLSAKNSLWFDHVYGKFNEQFGSYFNKFQKQQRKVPAEKNIQWRDEQGIPLSIYIKSNNEWTLVEKINPVGPMAFRDLVIPIDLEKIKINKIEIKLECGFMFWEVDYASIDFSKEEPLEPQYINPSSAIDENGINVTHLLNKEDKNYLVQPDIGNQVVLKYKVTAPKEGEKQSVFLKNRGYYEYIRDYKGFPNIAKLKTFKEKGALSKYSAEEYTRFMKPENLEQIVFNHE